MLQQTATTRFLQTLEHSRYGSMTVSTPDGKTRSIVASEEGAHATMHIRDWRTIASFAAKGDIGLAEAYRDGWWDSDDLTSLMQFGLQNEQALQGYLYGSALSRLAARFLYFFSRNTLKGSRRNIHAHYDLGNEFYQLWLDESMTYSAALFDGEEESLTPAQHRKYDRMIERLGAGSGLPYRKSSMRSHKHA